MLLFFVFHCPGNFLQVTGIEAVCPGKSFVFECSGTFVSWVVTSSLSERYPLAFSGLDSVGYTQGATINSSLAIFEVTSKNFSVITTMLTIMNPINLNGSIIECNGRTMELNVQWKRLSELLK